MDKRPDPDALLAQLGLEGRPGGRGRLKVFLGMAAGVGKTYAMLMAAQEAKRRGTDVVIGYVEPHGRAETEALTEGIEQLPLNEIEYRGVTLREFNIDAALARTPQLILVDELAHTNVAGSRHKKRWQDVQELLQAGIDVDTTVNIQHLESLNDVVAQITHVVVTETVPDSLINEADEVELVDLPPEELIKRLHEGKVYIPEKVGQALDSFFKMRNLLALRELSLRHTAERVEEQVRTARAAEGAVQPWHTTERILVCVAPNKMGSRAVRAAKRMANALHAELLAAFVESPRQAALSAADLQRASDALRLAESLGAKTVALNAHDIVGEIIRYSQANHVTMIVVGKPVRPRWREVLFGSVVDSLVRASGDIDVHVITGSDDVGTPLRLVPREGAKDWRGYGTAAGVTALATIVSHFLIPRFDPTNLVMIYLLGVAFVASRHSKAAAILASVLSVAAFDLFCVPPRGTFAVSDVQYVFTFGVMLLVALLVSTLTARLRDQYIASSERERRTAALYELSRKLSSTRSRRELGAFAAQQIRDVFDCDVGVLIRSRKTGDLFPGPESRTGFEAAPKEQAVARWVVDHGKRAGRGTDTLPGSEGLYLPLTGERGPVGVLAVRREPDDDWDVGQLHLLETFANQLAVAVERTNLAKDSHESTIEAERERLKSTLLSSVSHDFRTPLSVIVGAAEQLRSKLDSGPERDLAESIAEEASRLERQVRNLLDMTRLRSGALQVRKEWQSLEELVGSALSRTEALLEGRPVHLDLPTDLPLVELDGVLIEQVFVNLLENAVRHTPPRTNIWISAHSSSEGLTMECSNDGPSLSEDEAKGIFEEFSQGALARGGSGLGLAICRAILEAHIGSIRFEPRLPQGVRFLIDLPAPSNAPEVPVG